MILSTCCSLEEIRHLLTVGQKGWQHGKLEVKLIRVIQVRP